MTARKTILTLLLPCIASAAGLPSFDAPTIPHCGEKMKALAVLAGPNWREVA